MGNASLTPITKDEVLQNANPKTVIDPDTPSASPVTFESLYKGARGPVIFKFLRRFGCILCREGASDICQLKADMDKKYGEGVVSWIGLGLERLGYTEFKDGNYFCGKIYLDEPHDLYKAAGFLELSKTGILRKFFTVDTFSKGKQASGKGFSGDFKGEKSQLGGMLILSPQGDVLYHFRQETFGDEPPKEEIVKAIDEYFAGQKK